MITIEGLTKKQRAILDIMWSMDTKEQVESFVQSLPHSDRCDATSLMEILIHDSLEQQGALADYEEIAFVAVYTARYL
jgi:hypothetical protein